MLRSKLFRRRSPSQSTAFPKPLRSNAGRVPTGSNSPSLFSPSYQAMQYEAKRPSGETATRSSSGRKYGKARRLRWASSVTREGCQTSRWMSTRSSSSSSCTCSRPRARPPRRQSARSCSGGRGPGRPRASRPRFEPRRAKWRLEPRKRPYNRGLGGAGWSNLGP